MSKDVTKLEKAVGDYASTTFYYLLQVKEYIVKVQRNEKNQTVQFKLEDAMFLRCGAKGCLCQLSTNELDEVFFLLREPH